MAKKDAEQAVLDLSSAVPAEQFKDVHQDLDHVERQLSRIRRRQEALVEDGSPESKGKVEVIDLNTLIDLNEIDEVFDRRFQEFVGADLGDDGPRWLD